MIALFITSRHMVEYIGRFDDDTLVISIYDPGGKTPEIKGNHIYRWAFYDVIKAIETTINGSIYRYRPIEQWQAEQIVDVAFDNLDKERWVIHCEVGISRSPATVLGLAKHIKFPYSIESLERRFPYHNRYVRRLIEEAADRRTTLGHGGYDYERDE